MYLLQEEIYNTEELVLVSGVSENKMSHWEYSMNEWVADMT
jgi:hypothetical protein